MCQPPASHSHQLPHARSATGWLLVAAASSLFYWPRLVSDVEEFTGTCDVCQKIKVDHHW
ncbi:hypothetical protein K438DRAFT_1635590 [Mycena galopus ATCC 62051]|nr:hypothetical protein K438DRAFT_1635590 [Mycena galopus ATCC 62051]